MKRIMFFVLSTAVCLEAGAQNLVLNPGFESWTSTTRPSGWTHIENCLKDSVSVHSGSYSCRHTGGTSTSDLGQVIGVTEGSLYTLSLYYLTGESTTGNGSRIWCYWRNSSGTNITDPLTDAVMRPSSYLKSSIWAPYSITVQAPTGAASFYLEVRTNSNSMTYWDDFVFELTSSVAVPEIAGAAIEIKPNPVDDILYASGLGGYISAEIIDMNGMVKGSYDLDGCESLSVPVQNIEPGIYFLRLKTATRNIVRRFIRK